MPLWYSEGASDIGPRSDLAARIGTCRSWPKPKAAAVSRILSAPSLPAISANAVLHEWASALVSVLPLHVLPP